MEFHGLAGGAGFLRVFALFVEEFFFLRGIYGV
jgi:hypothetical protein